MFTFTAYILSNHADQHRQTTEVVFSSEMRQFDNIYACIMIMNKSIFSTRSFVIILNGVTIVGTSNAVNWQCCG